MRPDYKAQLRSLKAAIASQDAEAIKRHTKGLTGSDIRDNLTASQLAAARRILKEG